MRRQPGRERRSWPALAYDFHFGTKDLTWAGAAEAASAEALLRDDAARLGTIDPFKTPRGPGISLARHEFTSEFPQVLMSRRTWRGFGRAPVPRRSFDRLLDLTFGVRMHGRTLSDVPVLFKTSPSAGARHPIEAYVLARSVRGIPPGLYHYSPKTNAIHMVRRGASSKQIVRYLADQWWYGDAGFVVLMTAVLPRVWARYPYARAYRSVLLDAGHICQTFCLAATWLNLAPFCTQALSDSAIERDLGVDGVDEVLVYAAGAGTRPRGGRWVQWPAADPDNQFLPAKNPTRVRRNRR